jgi:carotenoid cleavage dioxygenase-like enzyme
MSVTTAPATHLTGFQSQLDEVRLDELEVTGAMPRWLSGTLVRNGPAQYEVGERTMNHWFDGLAMLHAFGFADGKVSYGNRFLRTAAYRAAVEDERIGYAEFATDPCRSVFARVQSMFSPASDLSPNANVNVVRLGERYLAMTETPLPVQFDAETLETVGVATDAGAPKGQHATAHPHHDPERDELVAYVVNFSARSHYVLYAVGADGSRREIASAPVDRPSYMHSFSLTPRYAVLAEFPIVVNPLKLAMRGKPFIANYHWDADRPARFLVFDRQAGELRGTYETEPFFSFHTINAFERDGELVVDLCAYDDDEIIQSFYLDRLRDPETVFPHVEPRRYEIDLDGGSVRSRKLADVVFELPRVNYRRVNGKPYRFAYGNSHRYPGTPGFVDQIAKLDVESSAVSTWHEDGCYPGEPVFVASPGAEGEDEGVLLSVVLDGGTETSFLLVLDAEGLGELARAHMPQHVPFGFHGSYFRS